MIDWIVETFTYLFVGIENVIRGGLRIAVVIVGVVIVIGILKYVVKEPKEFFNGLAKAIFLGVMIFVIPGYIYVYFETHFVVFFVLLIAGWTAGFHVVEKIWVSNEEKDAN